ncbi:3-oxoacyl-ACP synthase [Pedobacter sp. KR3-3]|uniref:3-oxoacyl-ACP synthase n=1 Tax=Pedobacter albus TaxID=3113905 RepID=A0ABU7I2T7_9SPHI|nr:3-oxoacyl-ACP synthase [Pedobacter sp. KR3-3]MEE1943699.1 3-oxoacyl-ACP synthase [Pedobacter sp. KR3-3]
MSIKSSLYQLCLAFVEKRIETAKTALQQAREASNDDTKSSAGDKFETSREMAQQDIERNMRLLSDAEEQLKGLELIKELAPTTQVRNGSLVYTDQGNFYMSISAGQLQLDQTVYFAISVASPIGKLFVGKQKGEQVDFNGKQYRIEAIL